MAMNLTKDGFDLTFSMPLDAESAQNVANFKFKRFYYEYHQAYGSKQFDVKEIGVKSISLSDDKTKVHVVLDDMKAGYVYEMRLGEIINANKSKRVLNNLVCYSLNQLK